MNTICLRDKDYMYSNFVYVCFNYLQVKWKLYKNIIAQYTKWTDNDCTLVLLEAPHHSAIITEEHTYVVRISNGKFQRENNKHRNYRSRPCND